MTALDDPTLWLPVSRSLPRSALSARYVCCWFTPFVLFAGLSVGEPVLGRVNSALQLRTTPRQRQNVARALFGYVYRHLQRSLNESFAGALANRVTLGHGRGAHHERWTRQSDGLLPNRSAAVEPGSAQAAENEPGGLVAFVGALAR